MALPPKDVVLKEEIYALEELKGAQDQLLNLHEALWVSPVEGEDIERLTGITAAAEDDLEICQRVAAKIVQGANSESPIFVRRSLNPSELPRELPPSPPSPLGDDCPSLKRSASDGSVPFRPKAPAHHPCNLFRQQGSVRKRVYPTMKPASVLVGLGSSISTFIDAFKLPFFEDSVTLETEAGAATEKTSFAPSSSPSKGQSHLHAASRIVKRNDGDDEDGSTVGTAKLAVREDRRQGWARKRAGNDLDKWRIPIWEEIYELDRDDGTGMPAMPPLPPRAWETLPSDWWKCSPNTSDELEGDSLLPGAAVPRRWAGGAKVILSELVRRNTINRAPALSVGGGTLKGPFSAPALRGEVGGKRRRVPESLADAVGMIHSLVDSYRGGGCENFETGIVSGDSKMDFSVCLMSPGHTQIISPTFQRYAGSAAVVEDAGSAAVVEYGPTGLSGGFRVAPLAQESNSKSTEDGFLDKFCGGDSGYESENSSSMPQEAGVDVNKDIVESYSPAEKGKPTHREKHSDDHGSIAGKESKDVGAARRPARRRGSRKARSRERKVITCSIVDEVQRESPEPREGCPGRPAYAGGMPGASRVR